MNNYEEEKRYFENNFSGYQDKRIVIYGLGRFTATLLPLLGDDWKIVGLMDKDPNMTGKIQFGIPVISLEEAERNADLVIINTSGSYWNMIYKRIQHIRIPVYFRNGQKADIMEDEYRNLAYWDLTESKIKEEIDKHDIVSFDFYDTLFQRKAYLPSDVYELIAWEMKEDFKDIDFVTLRKQKRPNNMPTLEEIYEEIMIEAGWTKEFTDRVKSKELEIERRILQPRIKMIELMAYAILIGKTVYLLSDMYLPEIFFESVLREDGIDLPTGHIWISGGLKADKRSGSMWRKYQEEVVKGSTAVHIGDNLKGDGEQAEKFGIDSICIMSKNELLQYSSLNGMLVSDFNRWDAGLLGLVASRLFQDPFAISKRCGRVYINDRYDFGYCILGPVLATFLFWLKRKVKEDKIKKLVFLGRDGYFLKEDFGEFIQTDGAGMPEEFQMVYLEASRQILMCSCIEDEKSFMEYVKFPYIGIFQEFVEDRFLFCLDEADSHAQESINSAEDYEKIIVWLEPYKERVRQYIVQTREGYKGYLAGVDIDEDTAVVDLGYYGTTQYYLSNIIHISLKGYYIVANLDDDNRFCSIQQMDSCVSVLNDRSARNANLHKKGLALESFLTAPTGMVRGINGGGKFVYDSIYRKNQEFFEDKREINQGVKAFIWDVQNIYRGEVKHDDFTPAIYEWLDIYWGECISHCDMGEDVGRSFYNDNAFVHRREEPIF